MSAAAPESQYLDRLAVSEGHWLGAHVADGSSSHRKEAC